MDGGAKKRSRRSATAARLLALVKKRGKKSNLSTAALIKFLVVRPDRKRKRKAGAKQPRVTQDIPWGTPTRYDHSKEQRPEEAATKAAAAVAEAASKPQFVIVREHEGREVESKDIVPYEAGDEIPQHAQIIAIWRDARGAHKRDVTKELRSTMRSAFSEVKDSKEAKEKAEEDAKHHRDEKHKAEADAKHHRDEKHKADVEKEHAKIHARREEEKNLDAKALEGTMAIWKKHGAPRTMRAASAAAIQLTERIDAKHPRNPRSIEKLVREAVTKGKSHGIDYGDGITVGDNKESNPIYDSYEVLRYGKHGTKYHPVQVGTGKAARLERPTSSDEIDKDMSKVPGYQGAVASDDSFEVKGTPNPGGVSWVMNLDRHDQPGSHWVAVLITPRSVEYFNSFGDNPTPSVQERIVAAGKRLWPDNVKTLKINKIKHQDERTSTCGFHAMKFIRDRMSGESFVEVTGYGKAKSQVRKSEEEVAEFEKRYPKFVQVGKGILDHPGDNMPYQVKSMLEQHGQEPVTSITVVRTPVNSIISKLLNVLTAGAFKAALAKYNYDQLFHLAIVVNGKYAIEKNATVQFNSGTRSGDSKAAPVKAGTKVEDLFKRGTSAGFWLYDPRSNNCQDFIMTVLQGVGSLTPELRTFVKQDAVSIFASVPSYAGKLAKFVTDLGGRFDGAKDKLIKFFRGGGAASEGADRTAEEIRRTVGESDAKFDAAAKKAGLKLNDMDMSMPENPLTWLLKKVGAKKLAKWLHKKDTGEDLQEGGLRDAFTKPLRLPGQYIGKQASPVSAQWTNSSALPRPTLKR